MYEIGPYRFTDTDARSTVRDHPEIWDQFGFGRDGDAVRRALAAHEPDLIGDLATDLDRVWSAWHDASSALRAHGLLPGRAEGTVAHLHRSDGGLPKLPVDRVDVDWRGVVGDRQASRAHHGRPWQALCIWSVEAIAEHRAAGHSVDHGQSGENVTVRGLRWADVLPGVHLRLGTVRCQVTDFAFPCRQNAHLFIDGDFMAMHHLRGPSRVYATVLEPGVIATGDPAILEP